MQVMESLLIVWMKQFKILEHLVLKECFKQMIKLLR